MANAILPIYHPRTRFNKPRIDWAHPLACALYGYWPLNGSTTETALVRTYEIARAGADHTGTLQGTPLASLGMPTFVSGSRAGESGSSMYRGELATFYNGGQGVSLANSTDVGGTPFIQFTVSAWLFLASGFTGNPRALATDHTDDSAVHSGFQLWYDTIGAHNTFAFDVGTNTLAGSGGALGPAGSYVDQWAHVVGVYDGTAGTTTVYVNGTPGTVVTLGSGAFTAGGANVTVGYNPSYFGDFWFGFIRDVAIWSRALNENEIKSLTQNQYDMFVDQVEEMPVLVGSLTPSPAPVNWFDEETLETTSWFSPVMQANGWFDRDFNVVTNPVAAVTPSGAIVTLGGGAPAVTIIPFPSGTAGSTGAGSTVANVAPNFSGGATSSAAGATGDTVTIVDSSGNVIAVGGSLVSTTVTLIGSAIADSAGALFDTIIPTTSGVASSTGAGSSNETITIVSGSASIAVSAGIVTAALAILASGGSVAISAGSPNETIGPRVTGAADTTGAGSSVEAITIFNVGGSVTGGSGTTGDADASGASGVPGTSGVGILLEALSQLAPSAAAITAAGSVFETIVVFPGGASATTNAAANFFTNAGQGSPPGSQGTTGAGSMFVLEVVPIVGATTTASAAGNIARAVTVEIGGNASTGAGSGFESLGPFISAASTTSAGTMKVTLLIPLSGIQASTAAGSTVAAESITPATSMATSAGTVRSEDDKNSTGSQVTGAGGSMLLAISPFDIGTQANTGATGISANFKLFGVEVDTAAQDGVHGGPELGVLVTLEVGKAFVKHTQVIHIRILSIDN